MCFGLLSVLIGWASALVKYSGIVRSINLGQAFTGYETSLKLAIMYSVAYVNQ
jgi:hypothetical protein